MNKIFREIKDNAEPRFSSKPDKITNTAKAFRWIIQGYLYHAIKAACNGYPIHIRGIVLMALYKEKDRKLSKREKNMYFRSHKVHGHIFSLKLTKGNYNKWDFIPAKKVSVRMSKILNDDRIYELLRS